MFIQTEATPNPATLKFLPGRVVMAEGTFEARDAAEAERSPLAKALMELPGVSGVFFANDFISVTKTEGEWQHLRPAVLGVVTEFFLSGEPLIASGGADAVSTGEFFDAKDSETVEAIKELIETRVRPAVAGDGGDIIFKGLQGRRRLSQDEGRLLRLPLVDRDAQARNRKPTQALPAGGSDGGADRGLKPCGLQGSADVLSLVLSHPVAGFYCRLDRPGPRSQGGGRAREHLFAALALPAARHRHLSARRAPCSDRAAVRPLRAACALARPAGGGGADPRGRRLRDLGADPDRGQLELGRHAQARP